MFSFEKIFSFLSFFEEYYCYCIQEKKNLIIDFDLSDHVHLGNVKFRIKKDFIHLGYPFSIPTSVSIKLTICLTTYGFYSKILGNYELEVGNSNTINLEENILDEIFI
jgi:hypothetical protein